MAHSDRNPELRLVQNLIAELTSSVDISVLSSAPVYTAVSLDAAHGQSLRGDGGRGTGIGAEDEKGLQMSDKDKQTLRKVLSQLTVLAEILERDIENHLCDSANPFEGKQQTLDSIDQPSYSKDKQAIVSALRSFEMTEFLSSCVMCKNKELLVAVSRLLVGMAPRTAKDTIELLALYGDDKEILNRYIEWVKSGEEPLRTYAVAILSNITVIKAKDLQLIFNMVPDIINWFKNYTGQLNVKTRTPKSVEGGSTSAKTGSKASRSNRSSAKVPEKYTKGSLRIYPPSDVFKQLSTVHFFTRMLKSVSDAGKKKWDLIDIMLYYSDIDKTRNILLTRQALVLTLRKVAKDQACLQHFIADGGLQSALKVPRNSMAAVCVTKLVTSIGYLNKALQAMSHLPKEVCQDFCSWYMWKFKDLKDFNKLLDYPALVEGLTKHDFINLIVKKFDEERGDGPQPMVPRLPKFLQLISGRPENVSKYTHLFALENYLNSYILSKAMEARSRSVDKLKLIPVKSLWENIRYLSAMGESAKNFRPIQILMEKKILNDLMEMICECANSHSPAVSALSIILVVSVTQEGKKFLAQPYNRAGFFSPRCLGFGVVLHGIMNSKNSDLKIVALQTLHSCVAGSTVLEDCGQSEAIEEKLKVMRNDQVEIHKQLQAAGGLWVLLLMVDLKIPNHSVDIIRSLAVRCLYSLCENREIAQIISRVAAVKDGHLIEYMKTPAYEDNMEYHRDFCRYATKLLERVTGTKENEKFETKMRQMTCSETELLKLMKDHLVAKGLTETANVLSKEASLTGAESTPMATFLSSLESPRYESNSAKPPSPSPMEWTSSSNSEGETQALDEGVPESESTTEQISSGKSPSMVSPLKRKSNLKRKLSKRPSTMKPYQVDVATLRQQTYTPKLDNIIKQYLQNVDAKCSGQLSQGTKLKLRSIHKCQDKTSDATNNLAVRIAAKQITPKSKTYGTRIKDTRFKFSRLNITKTISKEEDIFGAGSFHPQPEKGCIMIVGRDNGKVDFHQVDLPKAKRLATTNTKDNESGLISIAPSKSGKMLITTFRRSRLLDCNKVWKVQDNYKLQLLHSFDKDTMMSFSNTNDDRLVGMNQRAAYVYDTTTFQEVVKLYDHHISTFCYTNYAFFDPTDSMILADGILWDVRSAKLIHRFEQLSSLQEFCPLPGFFHPTGREIISQGEIWDMRTFRLLKSVPDIEPCSVHLTFSSNGDGLVGGTTRYSTRDPTESFLRTFDGTTYETLLTFDFTWGISALSIDPTDRYLAAIAERRPGTCRIYDIGRKRSDEEAGDPGEKDDRNSEEQRAFLKHVENPINSSNFVN
ncbi:DDB1- and CUL4-associated factor 1-like [Ptychodera flava]|uniref:DDB1- and CUL4-associated factor 1-like n=1 Tax=Ptychodera flava TaxID=63121 RepID=UPI00396A12C4